VPLAKPPIDAVKLCTMKFPPTDWFPVALPGLGVVPNRKYMYPGDPSGLTLPFKTALLLPTDVESNVRTVAVFGGPTTVTGDELEGASFAASPENSATIKFGPGFNCAAASLSFAVAGEHCTSGGVPEQAWVNAAGPTGMPLRPPT
jgi:hypothetical protein